MYSVAASMGAFSAATVLSWVTPILPHLLGPDSEIPMTPQEASWMLSIPEITNLLSPVPAGILADHFGRKPVILLAGPIIALNWLIIIYFKTFQSLVVARCLHGLAIGIVYTAIPVYLGEIASKGSRGAITSLFFIFYWAAFLFEYCAGPFLSFFNFTLVTMLTSVLFFVLFLVQPESPYYLLMKGNKQDADKSLRWFRSDTEDLLNKEFDEMVQSIEDDQKGSWKTVMATGIDRKALYLVLFVSSLRVLSGTLSLVSYATLNFNISPNLTIAPKYITIILGVVLVVGACCSFVALDIFGRRCLLILSSVGSSISLFIAGSYYYLDSETSVDVSEYSWIAPAATVVYAGVVVAGLYPVSTAYASELFTSRTRSIAAGYSAVLTTLLAFVNLKFYQTGIDVFGIYFNFFTFGGFCFIGAIVSYCIMPETKNKTFAQIRHELSSKNNDKYS